MRSLTIFVTLAVLLAVFPFAPYTPATAQVPKYFVTVEAGVGDAFIFSPDKIILPQVPVILNVTLKYNGTASQGFHTFTIRDSAGADLIDIVVDPGETNWTEFTVESTREISVNNETFTVQIRGGGVLFLCRPHVDIGMVGTIAVGTEVVLRPELGLFLRAYWIGLIGLAAMLVWTGIAYFIIKSSSRHFTDHHEHLRRGLP